MLDLPIILLLNLIDSIAVINPALAKLKYINRFFGSNFPENNAFRASNGLSVGEVGINMKINPNVYFYLLKNSASKLSVMGKKFCAR